MSEKKEANNNTMIDLLKNANKTLEINMANQNVEIISLKKEVKELTAIIKERDIALAYTKGEMQTYVDKVKEFSRLVDLLEDKELKLDNSIEHRQSPLLRLAAWALKNKHNGDIYN